VNVATFVVPLYAVEPATAVPAGSVTVIETPVTAWLKPTETVLPTAGTPVASAAGDCDTTVGRAAVVNDHDTGFVIAAPPSETAPDTVAVYVVEGASAALGVNVAIVPAAFSDTVPATELPWVSARLICVDPGVTARSNPATTAAPSATSFAPAAGVSDPTLGASVVRKAQAAGDASDSPVEAWAAATVAVYVTPLASGAVGAKVAVVFETSKLSVPGTATPPGSVNANCVVDGTTGSVNVKVTFVPSGTSVAFTDGV
jgi:hypothetical protein